MAKFEAIQEDGSKLTFAKVREDGSLIIQHRYYDPAHGGFAGMEEIDLLPEGVRKLLKLLHECSPTTHAPDGARCSTCGFLVTPDNQCPNPDCPAPTPRR
jgi:hypothetical protein